MNPSRHVGPGELEALREIYRDFARNSAEYRREAACSRGCAFCCTEAGRVDATTLEGWVIHERIRNMPRAQSANLKKALRVDVRKREAGAIHPCPFLTKTRECMIYDVRPFACRRIYSLHACTPADPPRLSRRVMELARESIADLQRLDRNGYSGHLSFVLQMLDNGRFLQTYLAGEFKPEQIAAWGRSHRIVINRMMV